MSDERIRKVKLYQTSGSFVTVLLWGQTVQSHASWHSLGYEIDGVQCGNLEVTVHVVDDGFERSTVTMDYHRRAQPRVLVDNEPVDVVVGLPTDAL